ncbi:MAG: entericidin A/B family lipoprotein [Caulobacteraceae bacterium]|jgi:predicted small secreted protein
MRKLIILAVVAAGFAVSACNTIAGAGRDVSSVGHAVTSTANDAKPN